MNPEMQQKIDEHIKHVVGQVHDSYREITSDLVKQVAEAKLDVMALSQQNNLLNKQSEAVSNQLKETLEELSDAKNELEQLRPLEVEPPTDGDSF